MPDMSGFEILDAYLRSNRNAAGVRKVVIMTLRTAQSDIDRALGSGISVFLYKPFSREDVEEANHRLVSQQQQNDGLKKKQQFLFTQGKVRILDCPPETSSKYRAVAGSLKSEIVHEIEDMAEEGFNQLVIKVGEGFLSDLSVTRKFVDLVEHTLRLSLRVRLVADSDQARDALKQFAETASIPTDTSLECALNSIE
jgi:response regulator RpfG family c-di-GMP phosphodiesterase